jgi:putative ABC transport system permease protein
MARSRSFRPSASFWEAARIAVDSLSKNKLRSFLTLLGIILATTTLIAVTSFIHGMNLYISDKLSNMGSDGFRVVRMAFIGNWDPKKFLEMQRRNPQIKPEEYQFIKDNATLLKDIGMEGGQTVKVNFMGETMPNVNLQGITENMPAISNIEVEFGRSVSSTEVQRHAAVAFIGNDIRDKFFHDRDPVGKTIQVGGVPYEIVGTAKALGSVFGESQDNFIMIPIQSFFKTYTPRRGLELVAKAIDQEHLAQAEDEVRMLLRAYRHIRPNQDDTFVIFASDTFLTAWQNLTGAIAATALGVVSVFLVVGGVVIMNIMLAVVTERTREIGVRKSLGARRRDIMNQFLVESAVLAGTGGLIGVILSWMLTILVKNATPLPMAMPITAVFLGVGLSVIVGLFFGIYPARQASKLDPIVALRAEN